MSITANSPWRCPPRISRDAFRGIIRSTDAGVERDGGDYYDYIAGRGVDPLYILAQFFHESLLGTTGVAAETHSWGNTRLPNFGIAYDTPTVAGRSGVFPVFHDWMDGLIATVERYLAPTWYYHDRPTIGSIFINDGPVWAPAGDLNDPNGYLAGVLDYMNAHADGGTMPNIPTEADIGAPVRVLWAADTGPARTLDAIRWFVVHTGEGSQGGDEAVLTSPNLPVESAHAYIEKDGALVFMVPLETTAWTAGNDPVSVQAIQVEQDAHAADDPVCTEAQYRTMAAFYRWCVAQGMANVPATYVGRKDADGGPEPDEPGIIGHMDVPDGAGGWGGSSHHTDPGPHYRWDYLLSLIHGGPPPGVSVPAADARMFPETGWRIIGGFRAYWEANDGMATFGFPITDERTENGVTVQYFERGRFELHNDVVLLGRVGSELLGLRGERGPGIDQ